MSRKKTTVYIDDELWRRVKAKAAMEGQTLSDYLNELLEKEVREIHGR